MENAIYNILNSLKKRLDKDNQLTVNLFDEFSFTAKFKFNAPASLESIKKFSNMHNVNIPNDYRDFLLLHNGAELFRGKYEAPIVLYGLQQIDINLINQVPSGFLPIGYYPDTGFIMINYKGYKHSKSSYLWQLDSDFIDLKCDFKTWLNRILVAQGMNYWEWYSEVIPLDTILNE